MISKRRITHRNRMIGVTLIELLSTVAIVGILASVAFSGFSRQAEGVRVNQAVAGIENLQLALTRYSTRPDRLAKGLPDELSELGLTRDQLIDPWGRPYHYSRDPRFNRDYDLFSLGKNGMTGLRGGDDFSTDDVVRGGNGSFFGTLADYAALSGVTTGQFSSADNADGNAASSASESGARFTR